jgi:thioredoxin-related protein
MIRILLTFIFILFFNVQANALELLMGHNPMCGICQKFLKEVAVDYDNKELPLIIINLYKQPEWFKEAYKEGRIKPIRGTPTFIVWNGRKELARIAGYYDKESFYEDLKEIIK